LRKSIFGEIHPYSKLLTSSAINEITRDDLIGYHQSSLACGLQNIIVAGSYYDNKFSKLLHDNFQRFTSEPNISSLASPSPSTSKIEVKELGDTSQASIAIGKQSMDNSQKEYAHYSFATKVLGGYFGSRLMKKLREEEGLTYGIHAFNNQLMGGSYLQISADVEINSVDKSVELILAEIDKLREGDISLHEIDTVKNYMIGEYVNDSNTVFDFAELYKKLILQNLPEDHYQIFYNKISEIEPAAIKSIAIESLSKDEFSVIKVY
jgi:zinc protease